MILYPETSSTETSPDNFECPDELPFDVVSLADDRIKNLETTF